MTREADEQREEGEGERIKNEAGGGSKNRKVGMEEEKNESGERDFESGSHKSCGRLSVSSARWSRCK